MMIKNMGLLMILMFLIGNFIYVSKHKHLLIILLSLEMIVLSIFFFFILLFINNDYNMFMLMVFLVFSVCEGVLGLSILISMIRSHGNDYFKGYNIL